MSVDVGSAPGQPVVFLIDDEVLVARLYARAVTAMGFVPQVYGSAEDALAAVRVRQPAMILSDFNLPGMSGLELVEALRKADLKNAPFMLMTADDRMDVVLRGLEAGVDDFLVKGVPFPVITERLRFWVDGPFRAMPKLFRTAAQDTFARICPVVPPIAVLRGSTHLLLERTRTTMGDLLMNVPDGFGLTAIDRIRFVGVLDAVIRTLCKTNGLAHLRRPDTMVSVISSLKILFSARLLRDQLPRLDDLSKEATFIHAGQTLSLAGS